MRDVNSISDLITSVFRGKTGKTLFQFIRYIVTGGIAFLADFGSLYILTEYVNLHYLISAAIAFLMGLIVNYLLSIKWVFNYRFLDNKGLEFTIFTVIGIIGLGLNELLMWVLTDLLNIYYLLSKGFTTILVFLWNFFARKYLLFNKTVEK